jgi:hypothetical protein
MHFLGVGFGESPGRVLVQVDKDRAVLARVDHWGETYVRCTLPENVEYAMGPNLDVCLETSEGARSNATGAQIATINIWLSHATFWYEPDCFLGICGGASRDLIEFPGELSEGYAMYDVVLVHHGAGWSQEQAPFAEARNTAQGYHVGLAGWDWCSITFNYYAQSPINTGRPGSFYEYYSDWEFVRSE